MTPENDNALRSLARQANADIKIARQKSPGMNVDDICRSVLSKFKEKVTLIGFTPSHLYWEIGVLNGRFKERRL